VATPLPNNPSSAAHTHTSYQALLAHPVVASFVNTNTASSHSQRVVVSQVGWAPQPMNDPARPELPSTQQLPILEGMLGCTGCRGLPPTRLRCCCCPLWQVVWLDGNQKRRRQNGWITDRTSRNPTQQTPNENPDQQQHRHQTNSSFLTIQLVLTIAKLVASP